MSMNQIQFLGLGADPEVFFRVPKTDTFISAEGKVGGTKKFPLPIPKLPTGFAVQEDNVSAEFNIPPATSADTFSANIGKALKHLAKVAKKAKLELAIVPAAHFGIGELATLQAQTLGCEPDKNAWTNQINPRPRPPETLRTAAGHVHISWAFPTLEQRLSLARALDVFVTIPSLLVTDKNQRRDLYGKAGCIREKVYGIEYRTPDNFWIATEEWRRHMFVACTTAISRINTEKDMLIDSIDDFGDEIQETINTHNRELALDLMNRFVVSPFPVVYSKLGA